VSEYPRVPLDGLATVQSGYSFKSADWQSTGVPVVKIANVKNGRIDRDGLGFVSPDVAKLASRFELKPEDVLVAMTGVYVGEMAIVRENDLPLLLNQRVGRCEPVSTKLDKRFLYYALAGADGRRQLENLAQGSAQPNLSAKDFGSVEIHLPPTVEQWAIAEVLGALDDKIESNRRLARVIQESMRAELRNSLTFGSEVTTLGELLESVQDRITLADPTLPYVGLEHFAGFNLSLWRFGVAADSKSATKIAQPGDLLFGRIRPYFGNVAILGRTAVVAQSVEVLRSRKVHYTEIAQLAASSSDFIQVATTLATGTTMPQVKWSDLQSMEVLVPTPSIAEKFHQYAAPLAQMLAKLPMESEHLGAIRDALLPELLSGRLRVRDAEKVVEAAV
jgi:type I restriction enzyme S subunit